MENIFVKRREVFFNNLILLGLDKAFLEKKHNVTFCKDMFVLPNKKGYEIVTYFLFSKLSSATGKDYNIPWPLVCKEHDRVFQKTCCQHLMQFSQENCVKFPRIVPSLLSTFGGDRFYEVYLAFSTYVLYKVVSKSGNARLISTPLVSIDSFKMAKENLQLSTILNMQKFRDAEVISYRSYKIWFKFARNLQESLRKLRHLLKSYDELIRKKKIILLTLFPGISDGSFDLAEIMEKCFGDLKLVLKQRKILDKFLTSERRYWQYLCSEVGENAESEFLNGQSYRIEVSNNLPEEYVKDLKAAGYLSSHENGKLSVERFMKILMAHLLFMIESLKKTNLDQLHKTCFVENASSIEDDLKCIENLNKKLSDEMIPSIEKSIEKLKIVTGYDNIEDELEVSSDQFCCPLPTPNFDVESVTQRAPHFDTSLRNIVDVSSKKQLFSKRDSDSVFLPETDPTKHSFISSTDQNNPSDKPSLFATGTLPGRLMVPSIGRLESRISSASSTSEVFSANPFTSTQIQLPHLDDLDFSCSTRFKMRESWLAEESLHTMTLPDMSFDE